MTVDAGISAHLDLGNPMAGSSRLKVPPSPPVPIYRPWQGQITAPINVTLPALVEVNQQVPPGRMYNILGFDIYSADGHSTLANAIVDVYLASSGVELPDFSCQIETGLTVPFTGGTIWYSKEVVWAQPGERLCALVYGFSTAAPVPLILMARIADYELNQKEATWIPGAS